MFIKLFASILHSTIWDAEMHVKVLWVTMLAMADQHGRVWASVPGLAHAARVPLGQCEEALNHLMSPDKHSRTKNHEGRRIAEIDGGWELLNYQKYREMRAAEDRREQTRRATAKYRAKKSDVSVGEHGEPDVSDVSRGEPKQKQKQKKIKSVRPSRSEVPLDPAPYGQAAGQEHAAGAADVRPPEKPTAVLLKIAHTVLDEAEPGTSEVELRDRIKDIAAKTLGQDSYDGAVVLQVLKMAQAQRPGAARTPRRPRKAANAR